MSTLGFLRDFARLMGRSSGSPLRGLLKVSSESSSASSSVAKERVDLAIFLRFFTFFCSSLNRYSTSGQSSISH